MRALLSTRAFSWVAALLICAGPLPAAAEEAAAGKDSSGELPQLTFSNLLYRLDGASSDFGFFNDDMRVLIVETLRNEGFRGKGAESLVFQRDDSSQADFAIGGTLSEAHCTREGQLKDCCRVGVDWELLDMARQEVVYKHRSRYGECHLSQLSDKDVGRRLVIGALRSLLHRDRFVAELKQRKEVQNDKPYAPAKLARCKSSKINMTKSSDPALEATVIVRAGKGHGSGFILTSSGFILTAAHVVQSDDISVKTRDGIAYRAKPVRVSRKFDVALLKAELPSALPEGKCLAINPEQQRTGAEIYAIGAPASEELGFSLTRGIVSGLRERQGVHYLQTDTPVSPGNSGGPLVDDKGRALAVVVSKLAGEATEGIAFGIPIDIATRALGLTLDKETDPALESAPAQALTSSGAQGFVDPADPVPTPKRDQNKVFNAASLGARVTKRRDTETGGEVLNGWFYISPTLELYLLSSPTTIRDRIAVRLKQTPGLNPLGDCRTLYLSVNGRTYEPLKLSVETMKSGTREVVEHMQVQYDIDVLKRVREHAPTVQVHACEHSWLLAPTQLREVQTLLSAHEAMSGVPL